MTTSALLTVCFTYCGKKSVVQTKGKIKVSMSSHQCGSNTDAHLGIETILGLTHPDCKVQFPVTGINFDVWTVNCAPATKLQVLITPFVKIPFFFF